jgi:hypothetical protein
VHLIPCRKKPPTGPQKIARALGLFEKINEQLREGIELCNRTVVQNDVVIDNLRAENESYLADAAKAGRAIEKLTELTGA